MVYDAAIRIDAALKRHSIIGPILREKKRFGCVVVFTDDAGDIVIQAVIGEKPDDCLGKHAFAREKIGRLMLMKHRHGHVLSRQSQDEHADPPQYAGAVMINEWGSSISGYPSLVDELFAVALLCQLGLITVEEALTVFRSFPNRYLDENRTEDLALL